MTTLVGQNIGRYHIVEQLGQGGMAVVYKAFDTRLERDVAIKVIRTEMILPAQLQQMLKRFEREARALAKMEHRSIVKIFDYGEFQDAPYVVMEYLPGGTLKELGGRQMSSSDAARLLLPIAQALDYAHQRDIIHRDVKPANILITRNGEPMLSDFGIAKLLKSDQATQLTTTGAGIGTPATHVLAVFVAGCRGRIGCHLMAKTSIPDARVRGSGLDTVRLERPAPGRGRRGLRRRMVHRLAGVPAQAK